MPSVFVFMVSVFLPSIFLLAICLSSQAVLARDFVPTSDAVVVEKLSPRIDSKKPMRDSMQSSTQLLTRSGALADSRVGLAISQAKQLIVMAKKTADPRYLGRAQATLMPWWDDIKAPAEVAVLKATVQQSRHEFDAARATLKRMLDMDPSQAQGWLTLATLERLSGNYELALQACEKVMSASSYALACRLETNSMLGQTVQARDGFAALIKSAPDVQSQAWFHSLLAESQERAGQDASALKSYRASIALSPDTYTALALSDLLLRNEKFAQALLVLAQEPLSDAVLIRRAYAYKQLNNPLWETLRDELYERFAALKARGDDERLHARELALAALWLADDGVKALPIAQTNLELQKEPFDWWLVMAAADKAKQPLLVKKFFALARKTKLHDARLYGFEQ